MIPRGPALLAAACLAAGVAGFGTGWAVNGWRLGAAVERLEGDKGRLEVQLEATGKAAAACTASVDQAARTARAAIAQGKAMLEEARRLHAGNAGTVERLEGLLRKPPPAGAGCNEAWAAIEAGGKP